MAVGHEYCGEIVDDRQRGRAASRSATASRARATSPAATAATAAPAGGTCAATPSGVGVNRAGLLRRVPRACRPSTRSSCPTTSPTRSPSILDPLGNAVHTALSFDLVGEDVLITGAGPIGIMAAAIARHVGARHVVITDVNDYRLELATQDGRDARRQRRRSETLDDVDEASSA